MLIISLVTDWTGNVSKKVKDAAALWITDTLDAIPLQSLAPDEEMLAMQGSYELGDEWRIHEDHIFSHLAAIRYIYPSALLIEA